MADAVLSNPNQRLVNNRFDDVECHNQTSDIEIPASSFKTILRKRRLIIISTFSLILLAVTATILSAVFIVKANQAKTFRKDLETILDKDFGYLDAEKKEKYLDDMVTLFKRGYVSLDADLEFKTYLEFDNYNKKYAIVHKTESERRERFTYFRKEFHDIKNMTGKELYTKEINRFSDMTPSELHKLFPAIKGIPKAKTAEVNPISKINVDVNSTYIDNLKLAKGVEVLGDIDKVTGDNLDWRRAKVISHPADQGTSCTSAWAFASVAAVESLFAINGKQHPSLSAQEVLSCDFQSNACKGGSVTNAFDYIKTSGVTDYIKFPYTGSQTRCKAAASTEPKYKIASKVFMTGKDILNKSLVISPTVVHISIGRDFLGYKSGLYDGPCGKTLNHTVLLVGEGYDQESNKRFWIIKNSWGVNWGEHGFARLVRTEDKFDKCDILTAGYNPSFTEVQDTSKAAEKAAKAAAKKADKAAKDAKKEAEKLAKKEKLLEPKKPAEKAASPKKRSF